MHRQHGKGQKTGGGALKGKDKSFCETGQDLNAGKGTKKPASPRTRLMRHKGDFTWQGVRATRYKPPDGTWAGAARMLLVGGGSEDTKFHLRYFELAPGGSTTLEQHDHEHVVVLHKGQGHVPCQKEKL